MTEFKKYIASQIIGKKLRFRCDCIMKMDIVGVVVDYELISNEIVFSVDVNSKIIKIGENHPDLYIKEE